MFRVRLMGTRIVDFVSVDYTGCWIDEFVPAENRDSEMRPYFDCLSERRAVHDRTLIRLSESDIFGVDRLFMPCASDGMNIDLILVGMYWVRMEQGSV